MIVAYSKALDICTSTYYNPHHDHLKTKRSMTQHTTQEIFEPRQPTRNIQTNVWLPSELEEPLSEQRSSTCPTRFSSLALPVTVTVRTTCTVTATSRFRRCLDNQVARTTRSKSRCRSARGDRLGERSETIAWKSDRTHQSRDLRKKRQQLTVP